ncbi:hypothetical protein [Streptomyces sp. NBC_00893]|uniref:hypothetical protein n=1 Tax=Streptomyces sp. NBC_00893 TaxID=2975862 RepID=UPI002255DF37|nr:hypothetical protein [Streptomyces sp. NBC_00893]MCX4846376.1 hypothetical protein [Streptomyces sp. NBC_00893]
MDQRDVFGESGCCQPECLHVQLDFGPLMSAKAPVLLLVSNDIGGAGQIELLLGGVDMLTDPERGKGPVRMRTQTSKPCTAPPQDSLAMGAVLDIASLHARRPVLAAWATAVLNTEPS